MNANELRRAFTSFFAERGHTVVSSMGVVPNHPRAPLFTNAGMNQFLTYILGEERPAYPRATSVQKCVRVKGKHDDIEEVGRSPWHLSFFEMLGNFSFGDYFKEGAIPLAWELVTDVFGLDPERIWITVHESDDEAEQIWRDAVGVPPERIQRMGADNFWEMGETGPCGPCSEMYYDKGEAFGQGGGPAAGSERRFLEFWNLVFMQYDRQPDGTLADLPMKVIDTGAGLERNLAILQGTDSVFETDELGALVDAASAATGRRYGDDVDVDVALRVLADHARTMTFLVNDGVYPSNEERGYVVRRIIRRAGRKAFQLGVDQLVTPKLVEATADLMADAYPELTRNRDFIAGVVAREEERFRQTVKSGMVLLEQQLAEGSVSGPAAFQLHDTFGFPIDLTREIAAERDVPVDVAGFEAAMEEQRTRARQSGEAQEHVDVAAYREVLDQFGTTEFTGYQEYETKGRVLAVIPARPPAPEAQGADGDVEVFLDRTPFYAESGGQVGDTGTISTDSGTVRITDTTNALPGLVRHKGRIEQGEVAAGQEALAAIDIERREAIRRNHTGTHLLHWALREVLGSHVKQAGSLVAPDRLRFDFSHFAPVNDDELAQVEDLANAQVLIDSRVRAYETSKDEAERIGAIAFFGDKYGEVVRVVEAGDKSVELCGGTHVSALGMIGPIRVVQESSIGANLRRIEALTGAGSLARMREDEELLERAADLLRATPEEVPERIQRTLEQLRQLDEQVKALRRTAAGDEAKELAAEAADGVVVARRDGVERDDLRQLAIAIREQPGVRAVVLGGAPPGGGAALIAAVTKDSGLVASDLIAEAARTVKGGGGKAADLAMAGGKDPSALDEALDQARRAAGA